MAVAVEVEDVRDVDPQSPASSGSTGGVVSRLPESISSWVNAVWKWVARVL